MCSFMPNNINIGSQRPGRGRGSRGSPAHNIIGILTTWSNGSNYLCQDTNKLKDSNLLIKHLVNSHHDDDKCPDSTQTHNES